MEKRAFGRSGITVPPLMFGCNVLGWTADEAMSFRMLDRLMEAGLNALDTADTYSHWAPGHKGGESETVIGNWLKARGGRDKVVIATKVGMQMGAGGGIGLSKGWIEHEIDASLTRLQTDYVDLYQAHKDDEGTPLEETLETFGQLVKAGKVRAIGASNYTAARLKAALETSARLGLPRFETLQPHYNLMERPLYEPELEPLCEAEGLGVIPYFSLAAGFLTGKYRSDADLSKSPRGQNVRKYLTEKGTRVLAALEAVAKPLHATPGEVAIAWLAARPSITAPIASATRLDQLEELIRAVHLKLAPSDIATLDAASA